jgi:hypothetical protein
MGVCRSFKARHRGRVFGPQEASGKYLALIQGECQTYLALLCFECQQHASARQSPERFVSTIVAMLLTH